MLRLLLNALLAIVAARFLFGLFRWMGSHDEESGRVSPGDRVGERGRGGAAGSGTRGRGRPAVDRSQVIDVPFTEEEAERDPAADAPAGSAAAGSAAAGSAPGSPEREAR